MDFWQEKEALLVLRELCRYFNACSLTLSRGLFSWMGKKSIRTRHLDGLVAYRGPPGYWGVPRLFSLFLSCFAWLSCFRCQSSEADPPLNCECKSSWASGKVYAAGSCDKICWGYNSLRQESRQFSSCLLPISLWLHLFPPRKSRGRCTTAGESFRRYNIYLDSKKSSSVFHSNQRSFLTR